ADRNIGHELRMHGGSKGRTQVAVCEALPTERPITRDAKVSAAGCRPAGRRKGEDAFNDCERLAGGAESEVGVQTIRRYFALRQPALHQRSHLGGECKSVACLRVVQGLDSQSVARQKELLTSAVPDRKREHAAEPVKAIHSPARVR